MTRPSRCFSGLISHSSFMPSPYFCGSTPSESPYFAMTCFESEPRTPSPSSTYLPETTMPGS